MVAMSILTQPHLFPLSIHIFTPHFTYYSTLHPLPYTACARISKTLQHNFEPYMEMVMAPLIQGATRNVDFSIEDAQLEDVEGETVDDEETG